MKIVNLDDYRSSIGENTPAQITFFGAMYRDQAGNQASSVITLTVMNGDVLGALDTVREHGGIGTFDKGVYHFIPWPCAAVQIRTP